MLYFKRFFIVQRDFLRTSYRAVIAFTFLLVEADWFAAVLALSSSPLLCSALRAGTS